MGRERAELAAGKRELAARTAPFFDTQGRVRDLEAAYRQMWDQTAALA
jgi:predicted O-linked N-acetylglucosamine transferase (SPINDLY family)